MVVLTLNRHFDILIAEGMNIKVRKYTRTSLTFLSTQLFYFIFYNIVNCKLLTNERILKTIKMDERFL